MDEHTPSTRHAPGPIDTSVAASNEQAPSTTPKLVRDSSVPSISTAAKRFQPRRVTSATNSPLASRESSPVRPPGKGMTAAPRPAGPGRPRKNSSQDVSPSRLANASTNPPSVAAAQRVLSPATTPTLHPAASDPAIRAPTPLKPSITNELKDAPRWPVSPRLRSPPPINKPSIAAPRKAEQDSSAVNAQKTSQLQEQPEGKHGSEDIESEDSLSLLPGMRTPARGVSGVNSTLETVQEISQPSTPALEFDGSVDKDGSAISRLLTEIENPIDNAFNKILRNKSSPAANESGSDSGGKGSEIKMRATSATPAVTLRAPVPPTKSYSISAAASRGKPSGEGSTRNMTVETETVSSIPQIAVGGGVGGIGSNGSLRAKPSSETIRPKKEKKKTTRKAPSVTSGTGERLYSRPKLLHHHHSTTWSISDATSTRSPERAYGQGPYMLHESSGTTSPERPVSQVSRSPSLNLYTVSTLLTRSRPASSKADIFEAKVASAVDEANSSDSEETFVYESNPPESNDRPRRFHSRTPSATSMASQVDQRNGVRSAIEGGHSVAMKKSMKFVNSYTSNGPESAVGEDDGKGTARSNMGTGRGTTHHHHIGRWGRNGGNGHPSLFDNESPFPNAAKSKLAGNNRLSSRPTSPKVANSSRTVGNGKKTSPISSGYDLDDGADDERTPLMSSIRSARSNRSRRPGSSMRQLEHQASRQQPSFLNRFAGCLVLFIMTILVISGALGFMFSTTQPLTEVKIMALKNILASEQDVILDLQVMARNTNLVAVSIDSMDMVVFAKSKYAGTDSEWWRHPLKRGLRPLGKEHTRGDDFWDPPTDKDPKANPNLEIGHIYEFESPLTFEGSPFHHSHSISMGQIRVLKPGNQTEPSGSERWGRVLQHEFELIVKGTLKYTLPLSQKVRRISVEGRASVEPNAADQDPDLVHIK
ncbi:hypothetical protein B7494_g2295 [Chlorociboria aeruginascens]|nr:hypothetical protein B7494_g2295 [Chlorociboria aeruginascens]